MKKNPTKKLRLAKETFKQLGETALEEADGATAIRSCYPGTCERSVLRPERCA